MPRMSKPADLTNLYKEAHEAARTRGKRAAQHASKAYQGEQEECAPHLLGIQGAQDLRRYDAALGGAISMITKIPGFSIFILLALCFLALGLAPSIMESVGLTSR